MIEYFHFLYAEYLYLLLPIWLLIFWLIQRQDEASQYKKLIEPEFLPFLLEKPKKRALQTPIFLGLVLSLMIFSLSGPSYKLNPYSGKKATSEFAFVLRVSESMQQKDLMPSRLIRAQLKMRDILHVNSDAKVSLIAYDGSAHLVMPLIQDSSIIERFSASLSPNIMPRKGDALHTALQLASEQFVNVNGTIIILSDTLSKEEVQKIEKDSTLKAYKIIFYNISSQTLQKANAQELSQTMGATFIAFSRDERDVERVQEAIVHQYENSQMQKEGAYINSGYEVLPLILLLLLLFFRKGFLHALWNVR